VDPMKVNAFEYPLEDKEVLTKLLMEEVPVPMKVKAFEYPEE
jgi:hypothetical protein